MNTLIQDVRYALRQLRRSPGFAATAILTLALGIGATTSIFILVYQVILRSIPVEHPEQIYKVGKSDNCCTMGGGQDDGSLFSFDLYRSLRDQTQGTDGPAAVMAGISKVSARRAADTSTAQPLAVRFVSGNYFSLLGVRPHAVACSLQPLLLLSVVSLLLAATFVAAIIPASRAASINPTEALQTQ